jgi:3',5'-nucleoside bisphosphate phosphatase
MTGSTRPASNVDLHVHTTASDGTLTPREVVRHASSVGITHLGIVDHDSTAGLNEAIEEAARLPEITVIPGVELSATSSAGGDLHLLGYCIDPAGPALQEALDHFRRTRETRIARMVERLRQHDVPITQEQVDNKSRGGSVSRAHVGRVLIDLGVVETVDQAFSEWLGRGRPGFVPREPLRASEAIRLVLATGGVPVLAHPLTMGDYRKQLPELIDAGLKGIEVYYGPYSADERNVLREVAARHRLIATGGSDFHGPDDREGRELGSAPVPIQAVDELKRLTSGRF